MSELAGWALALALACICLRLRRRLELVAAAEHELRGPATAIGLAAAALRREPGGLRRALSFESELERMRVGLDDLTAARVGRRSPLRPVALPLERVLRGATAGWRPAGRPMRFHWDAGPAVVRADRRRLAQAFSNLLANAVVKSARTPLTTRTTTVTTSSSAKQHGLLHGHFSRAPCDDDRGGACSKQRKPL